MKTVNTEIKNGIRYRNIKKRKVIKLFTRDKEHSCIDENIKCVLSACDREIDLLTCLDTY